MANVLAVFSQFERRLIGQRTKDALAVKPRRESGSVDDGCWMRTSVAESAECAGLAPASPASPEP